jgi:hypothetical protein
MLALRLYQAEKGQLPATLQAVVPGILPNVPVDPYTGQPFGYRISAGEELPESGPSPEPIKVAPGQAILTTRAQTFLVPPPAR